MRTFCCKIITLCTHWIDANLWVIISAQNRLLPPPQRCSQARKPWKGRGAPVFGRSVNPISIGVADYAPKLLLASPTGFADHPTALCSWSCSTMIPMDFEQIVSPLWWAQQAPPCSDQMKRKIQMRCPPADKENPGKVGKNSSRKRG